VLKATGKGRVIIVHREGKANRARRHPLPVERRRDVVTLTTKASERAALSQRPAIREVGAGERERLRGPGHTAGWAAGSMASANTSNGMTTFFFVLFMVGSSWERFRKAAPRAGCMLRPVIGAWQHTVLVH